MSDHRTDNNAVSGQPQKTIQGFDPPQKPKRNKYAIACAILASMTSILLGYDIGVMSGDAIYIKDDLRISDVQVEVLLGILNLYSIIGSAVTGRTSDWVGRRYNIVLAGAIFFAGAYLMGFATNYAFLMFSRFVAGIGVGYALMIAPVYTAEVYPASSRGFLTSFPEVFINAGILLGYVSNYAFSKVPTYLGWRLMLDVGAVPSIPLALVVLAMPESPCWLVMQGQLDDMTRVLDKTLDSKKESLLCLADIKEVAGIPEHCTDDIVQVAKRNQGQDVWKELPVHQMPAVRHILICTVGIHFFQQASGINVVVLYSPRIFDKARIINSDRKLLCTVAVGFVKTVFILVATFFHDKVGRRPLLIASVAGMIFSLMGLSLGLTIVNQNHERILWAVVLCSTMVLLYVVFFPMGMRMGPITWVYSSEIFPLKLRAQGCSIGVAMNRVVSEVLSMTFISLYKAITMAWVFFYTMLPETHSRTLEDMEVLFGKFHKWRKANALLKQKKHGNHGDGNNNNDQVELRTKGEAT